ncbi:MAG TPA: hypothetical protein VG692_08205 [Gemmatimonadales bacterium]|nr:hypothetical protein [Gemmatimonadales bacterium]
MNRTLTAFGLLLLLGCAFGGSVARWRPASQAAGMEIELNLVNGGTVKGELLTLDSAGFLVLEATRLVRVDPVAVRSGAAYKTGFDSPLDDHTRERLRLMSRYPQGLPAGVEQSLLEAYGWTTVDLEVGPPTP